MIEAVAANVSSASSLRAIAEQTSTTQSFSSNPNRIQAAAIVAPYLSPHVDLNGGNSKPIFVVRDAETGSNIRQFPTEGQIRAYQRAKEAQARALDEASIAAQFEHHETKSQSHADLVESSVEFRQLRQQIKTREVQVTPGSHSSDTKETAGTSESAQQSVRLDTTA
ncbi:MAG: hypothetical protein JNK24_03860 [Alphaproteobacteria bacterium]|nr:hypothetical protein [Alphaproteobacteria bacterium]